MIGRWLQQRRAKQAAADAAVRRAGQVQAAVDLAISESNRPRLVTSLSDPIPQLDVDPFTVIRLADSLFGIELDYAEARLLLVKRMGFRGYLGGLFELPDWLTEADPLADPPPPEEAGSTDEPG